MPFLSRILSILLLCWCGLPTDAAAQFRYEEQHRHIQLETGYYAVLDLSSAAGAFRNGQKISAAYSLVNKYKEKLQRKTSYNRIVDRDIYIGLDIAHYYRKDLHHALLVSVGPSYKITIPEGMFFSFGTQLGYLHTFLKGEGFSYDGTSIQSAKRQGNDYFGLEASAGLGWSFSKSNDYPVYLFLKGGLMTYFPNNGKWLLQPSFNGGIGWVIGRTKQQYQ